MTAQELLVARALAKLNGVRPPCPKCGRGALNPGPRAYPEYPKLKTGWFCATRGCSVMRYSDDGKITKALRDS